MLTGHERNPIERMHVRGGPCRGIACEHGHMGAPMARLCISTRRNRSNPAAQTALEGVIMQLKLALRA